MLSVFSHSNFTKYVCVCGFVYVYFFPFIFEILDFSYFILWMFALFPETLTLRCQVIMAEDFSDLYSKVKYY